MRRPVFRAIAKTPPQANYYMFAEEPLTAIHSVEGNVGYINVKRQLTYETSLYRGISYQRISSALRELESNDQVDTIVFLFNSPGGDVTGLTDMMDDIRAVEKTTVAYAVGMCASAAFCMAWQCDEFYAAETASVGSVGVITAFYDEKTHLQSLGIPYDEFINDGSEKKRMTFGNEEDVLNVKEELNDIIGAILSRMDATDQSLKFFGNGRTFSGIRAEKNNLIDEVMTMRDLQNRVAANTQPPNPPNPAEAPREEPTEIDTPVGAQTPTPPPTPTPVEPVVASVSMEDVKQMLAEGIAPMQQQLQAKDQEIARLTAHNTTLEKRTNIAAAVSAQISEVDSYVNGFTEVTAESVGAFLLKENETAPTMGGQR